MSAEGVNFAERVQSLADELGVHPLVAEILLRRGVSEPAAARGFLDPDFYRPQLPEALPGVRAAAAILQRALAAGRRILIWGDFDVDGQTATALLFQAFEDLARDFGGGAPAGQVRYHIPIRATEGHGVSLETLRGYFEPGGAEFTGVPPELMVTCDTGMTAFEAVEYARSRGAQVIITDHHEPALDATGTPRLPVADAVVTPRRLPLDHPLAGLPGVGVAYKLVEALYELAGRLEDAEDYLDLAALGIVADVAEQTGDTRYLLQLGLKRLRATSRPGLLAVYERAGLKAEGLTEEHIGFALGPRLNAIGRLGDANPAVELLTTRDSGRARLLALQLEGLNARRQLLTSQTLRAALAQVETDPSLLDGAVLTLAHPTWEPGIIGIVAGRLAERFGKPVALIAAPTSLPGRGSARSVPGIHITNALAANAALLNSFGGHAGAAGFSVDAANIPALRRGLSRAAAAQLAQQKNREDAQGGAQVFAATLQPGEAARVDAVVAWEELSPQLAEQIERLAPFGQGNPSPALACLGVKLVGQAAIGRDGEHIALRLAGPDGLTRRALWWGGAEFAEQFPLPEGPFDAVVTLRATTYRGERELQLEWLGYRLPAASAAARPAVRVDDFRAQEHAMAALEAWLAEVGLHPQDGQVFIWAEGDARRLLSERLEGCAVGGRDEIPACDVLAIWTSPPGTSELAAGLKRAGARRVALFAVDAGMDAAQAFLERLAGAVRGALKTGAPETGGEAALLRLAAITAQRESAVRLGLEWLEAQAFIRLHLEDGRALLWLGEPAAKSLQRSEARLRQLRDLLTETRAYRAFYARAEPDALDIAGRLL